MMSGAITRELAHNDATTRDSTFHQSDNKFRDTNHSKIKSRFLPFGLPFQKFKSYQCRAS